MAELTFAQAWTPIVNAITFLEEARKFAHTNSSGALSNWVAREDTFVTGLDGDSPYQRAALDGITGLRGNLAALLVNGRAVLDPLIFQLGKTINAPEDGDVDRVLDRLYDYMVDNAERITSRQFVRGAAAAGGANVGNGSIVRCTVDENNLSLEASFADVATLECLDDENTGAPFQGQEGFEIRGRAPGPDALEQEVSGRGSGTVALIRGRSADDSVLENSSFESLDIANASIPSWTSTVTINATNYAADTTNYYIESRREGGTPQALNIRVTATLRQALVDIGRTISPGRPYVLQVAYNAAVGTAVGTLALHQGSRSTSATVTGAAGWNILRLPVGQNSWPDRFNEANLDAQLVATLSSGELLVDDVRFVPMDVYDGAWLSILGGSTPFLRDDTFTITDTETGAIIQRWFWRLYQRFLPATTGSTVTIAEPSV